MHLCLSMAINRSLQCCYLRSCHSREPDPNRPLHTSANGRIIDPFSSACTEPCPQLWSTLGHRRAEKKHCSWHRGASAVPAHGELTGSQSCQTKPWPGCFLPSPALASSTCQLRQAGERADMERAGVERQCVPDGMVPAGAVSRGQKDAAMLPWKWSAVFRLRASTVSSVSAHSRTSLRPYKCVLWHKALNAFCRIKKNTKQ